MDFKTNLEDFILYIKSESFTCKNLKEFCLLESEKKCFAKFCHKKPLLFAFTKIIAIKKFVKNLIKCNFIKKVKVKIHPFKKGHAYMLDKGEVHFFKENIFFQPYEKMVFTVLHELAHVYLSQMPNYPNLLKLDSAFWEACVKQSITSVISPIEYYANLFAYCWIKEVISPTTKRGEKLQKELNLLLEKINCALKTV